MKQSKIRHLPYQINLALLVFAFLIALCTMPLVVFFLFTQQKVVTELETLESEQHLHRLHDELSRLESKFKAYENMIGFVSQLPAVFEILEEGNNLAGTIDRKTARKRYQGVLSRAFEKNNDVINIHILNIDRQVEFSLMKSPGTLKYHQVQITDVPVEPFLLDRAFQMDSKGLYLSPLIESDQGQNQPRLILRMLTPIFLKEKKVGVFCSDIDIGILIKAFPGIHWVRNDGRYLSSGKHIGNAFSLFPGLDAIFIGGESGVWRNKEHVVVWDPFLKGAQPSLVLWAGKDVILDTVHDTTRNLLVNGFRLFGVLLAVILLISIFFARYTKRISERFLRNLKLSILKKENAFPVERQRIHEFSKFSESFARILDQNKVLEEGRQKTLGDLRKALEEVKTLQGILPICSICKKIRNDKGYFEQIEAYIHKHTGADFSHTICEPCLKTHYPEEYESMKSKKRKNSDS